MVMTYWLAAPAALSLLSILPAPVQPALASEGFAQGAIVVSQQSGSPQSGSPQSDSPQTNSQQTRAAASISAMEQAVLQQINEYRRQKGLSALTLNATISRQARIHSQDMANSHVLSHDGFNTRIQTIGKSIAYRAAAENVAYNMGYANPDRQAVTGWIKSTGHRQNIEGNYRLTGIGVAKNAQGEYYFTQIFIRQ